MPAPHNGTGIFYAFRWALRYWLGVASLNFFGSSNEIAGGMELQIFANIPDGHIGVGRQFPGKADSLGKMIVGQYALIYVSFDRIWV